MTPQDHVKWLADNTTWFENLTVSQLKEDVPCCPGWVVQDVINHLSFGVGLAYPLAVSSSPSTPGTEVFAEAKRPAETPTGDTALVMFVTNMRRCIELFSEVDPETPCWTYAGPGTASFWLRRAAVETAVHRVDVEEALLDNPPSLPNNRAADGISEAVDFALPLAMTLVGQPAGHLVVSSPDLDIKPELGEDRSKW